MITMAKYYTYGWHPYGKNYEMDNIFFHLGESWYLSVIIDEYCGATLSIGELGMRNVVSLHCDSEREVPHGSHGSHGFSSLQAMVLYTSTLTVKKICDNLCYLWKIKYSTLLVSNFYWTLMMQSYKIKSVSLQNAA